MKRTEFIPHPLRISFEEGINRIFKEEDGRVIEYSCHGGGFTTSDIGINGQFEEVIYELCEKQLAQIECRICECIFYKEGGCVNASPAITLNSNGTFNCWSKSKSNKNEKE